MFHGVFDKIVRYDFSDNQEKFSHEEIHVFTLLIFPSKSSW